MSRSRSRSRSYHRFLNTSLQFHHFVILYMLPNSNLISFNSASPARRSASPHKSPPPRRSPTPEKHTNGKDSPLSRSVSPSPKRASSHSPGSDGKVRLMFDCWLFSFLPIHLSILLLKANSRQE
jgi:arginine/serine-rich splicing factor 2